MTHDIIQPGFDFGTTFNTGDKVDVSTIDPNVIAAGNQAFQYIDTDPFTNNNPGQIRVSDSAGNTIIQLNTDNDRFSESEIEVVDGTTVAAFWDAIDFFL